jgi:CRISPR-associated protein Cas6
MLWQEENSEVDKIISTNIVDLVFDINCTCLPLDHAYALSEAIIQALAWFENEADAGLHLIHGAESGNGWYRPADSILYLSRRTKLTLRVPEHRIADAQVLTGMTLDIGGYSLTIGAVKQKPLIQMPVLFARHIIANPEQDEDAFIESVVAQLEDMGIKCRKALCGKTNIVKLAETELFTRSLMIADMEANDSIRLQQLGIGEGRKMGCGLFIPHKDIKAVNPDKSN